MSLILATGNLATPRRTVLGLLAHLHQLGWTVEQMRDFLIESGLPPIALDDADIPITLEQELICFAKIIALLDDVRSPQGHAVEMGLEANIAFFGVLGLALLYAEDALEVIRVLCAYPELCWGHSRIIVSKTDDAFIQTFVADSPVKQPLAVDLALLRAYCVTVDLVACLRMSLDVFGDAIPPLEVWLPYPAPFDHAKITRRLGCHVRFDAPQARLIFPLSAMHAKPLLANRLVFRGYEKLARKLAKLLSVDVDLSEQVRRLLWVSAPPPDRDTVARMLALSPRTLSRKLAVEGTCYADLRRHVQMSRAQEDLRDRALNLSEIADRLGFSDATAFSRAFRAWSGETPSRWRKRELDSD